MSTATADTPDDALVSQYVSGDTAAFDRLYARYRERVWAYAYRASGFDTHRAADVCQDTWLRVVKGAPGYAARGRFDRWVFGIAHNVIVDHHRRQQPTPSEPDTLPDLADFVHRFEVTDTLEQVLSTLRADQRSALLLHYVEGYTLDEIAALQSSGRETIKSRVRYGLNALRDRLGGTHGTH
ncbi:MAG: sigma-70 family RNA polymerase sigma factor [Pseudomonadota bacterium]